MKQERAISPLAVSGDGMTNGSGLAAGPRDLLRLVDIHKQFGSVVALSSVNLTVAKGEFVTLLGPSGSGKTTLLNIIVGVVPPTSGRIFLSGTDMTDVPPRRRGIGMVFQHYALMPHLSVFDNIAYPLRVRRRPAAEINQKVTNVLDTVRLQGLEQRRPKELSGGQQQRVSIARCLVYDPAVILMDEPLGALDKKLREQMQVEIKRLHAELGVTIVYVTHDQGEALTMSDRICLMRNGGIEQIGAPQELYFRPVNRFVADFLGESNLLSGEIGGVDGEVVIGSLGSSTIRTTAPKRAAAGERVEVLLRPESIRLLQADEDCDNQLQGTVAEATFAGEIVRYLVRTDHGESLLVKSLTSGSSYGIAPGTSVRIGWDAEGTILLPKRPA